jgi:hypothetical protein
MGEETRGRGDEGDMAFVVCDDRPSTVQVQPRPAMASVMSWMVCAWFGATVNGCLAGPPALRYRYRYHDPNRPRYHTLRWFAAGAVGPWDRGTDGRTVGRWDGRATTGRGVRQSVNAASRESV